MCGIVAYAGSEDASPILLQALARLEYRGYDSAGLTVQNGAGLVTRRAVGKLEALARLVAGEGILGDSGIAHTRWATHGPPCTENAHPHLDCSGDIAVAHNGIIENADALRAVLERQGHTFRSGTDSEVLAHLIEEHWVPPLHLAVVRALEHVQGTYGLAVMTSREPGRIVCARRGSPLLVGLGQGANFAASDVAAVLPHTRRVIYLDDGELAIIDADGCDLVRMDAMARIEKPIQNIEWELAEVERAGYEHYMLKEIHEQPATIERTLRGRVLDDPPAARLGGLCDVAGPLSSARRIVFTACGTSRHAALIGKSMIEELARVQADVEYASEWRYRDPVLEPNTVVVGVSQSGETADTLAALRLAAARGCTTIGVVNVVGSTIARETDAGLYLHAGPEIGVASTKAFTSQIVALALLAVYLGRQRGLEDARSREFLEALRRLPEQAADVLARADSVARLAARFADHDNFLYLGRGYSFPVALEGALKLKEISYVHAEGFSAAEMKHGPIALMDSDMPVVVVAPRDAVYPKVLSGMQEVKARGGRIIAIATEPTGLETLADEVVLVPPTLDPLLPVLTSIPLQLLAYHIGRLRRCDVDKPRNLAKAVTVE
ncbi:MAG: glutamine--fructose-6-phosphate transaminase (isomerizing) [Gemmatimonadota bacterium]